MKIKSFINKSIIFIHIFSFLIACARDPGPAANDGVRPSQDSFELLPLEADEEGAPGSKGEEPPLSEPISPDIVAQHPHLQHHMGQILLGNSQVHIVLSGIPPIPSPQRWQPAILEIFQKQGETWQKFGGLGSIELKLTNGNEHLTPIGLDTNITNNRASVTFIFAGRQSQGQKAKLTYHLAAHEPSMQMLFEEFMTSKNARNRAWDWQLRFNPNAGEMHFIPEPERARQRAVTHIFGSEVTSLVGFGPLDVQTSGNETIIGPPRGQAYKPGVEVFLGQHSAGRVPFKVVSTENCYQKFLKKGEVSHGPLIDCRLKAQPGFLKIALAAEDAAIAKYPRLLFLKDQNDRVVGIIPGIPGEDYQVFLSLEQTYRIIEINDQGEQVRAEFKLNGEQVGRLKLAARKAATFNLALGTEAARLNIPAIMEITNTYAPRTIPVGAYVRSDKTMMESLSPYKLLVKKWPLSIDLPPAKYQVSIYRGQMGVLCHQEINLVASARNTLDCRVDKSQEKAQLKNAVTADFATQIKGPTQAAVADVLGVHMLASDPFSNQDSSGHVGFLPIKSVEDPMHGIQLRLFGVTPTHVNTWREFQKKAKGSVASQVMQFAQEQSPRLLTELVCPDTGMNIEDYVRLMEQLKPDIVQVFGCGSLQHQERIFKQMTTVLKGKPPLLSAATIAQSYFRDFYFARWAFPVEKLTLTRSLTADDVLPLIQQGNYSLSAGAYLTFLSTDKSLKTSGKKAAMQVQAKVEALPESTPTRIILWGDHEILQEQAWNPAAGNEQLISFQLKKRPRSRWLRVELRGKDEVLAKQGSEIVLATTNFVPLP